MAQLSLKHANQIIQAALELARSKKYTPLAVVVLDASGHLVSGQREDGASMFRIDVATGKAWGAVAMGCSSRALGQRAKENPNFLLGLAATSNGKLLAQQGAVLIVSASGEILGSCGASGASGDQDEECCAHGVRQAGFATEAK